MRAQEIIKKPLLTEKSYAGIHDKIYTFVVEKSANKIEIAKAVEELFGVEVAKVNTSIVKGTEKATNSKSGRNIGNTGDYKKAIVVLKENSKPIAFFESLS